MSKKYLMLAACIALLFAAPRAQANHLPPPNKIPPTVLYEEATRKAAECLRGLHLTEGSWEQWSGGDVYFTRYSHSMGEDTIVWEIRINAKARAGKLPGIDPKKIDVCIKGLAPPPDNSLGTWIEKQDTPPSD